jgi:predicted nucleotidyltransferase
MPSELSPFLRSDAQGAVLAEVFLSPEAELTISEIARKAAVPKSVAHREISRLVDSGVLNSRDIGRNRMIRANQNHPLFALMSELVAATYGPLPVLRGLLAKVPGVDSAYIYGSWALRRTGEPGAFPGDVDVLVVGDVDRADTVAVSRSAHELTGQEINIHVVTPEAWSAPVSVFLQNVRSQPLVPLIQRHHDPSSETPSETKV